MPQSKIPLVAIVPDDPSLAEAANALAEQYGIPLASGVPPYELRLTQERLELRQSGPGAPGAVFVDFVGGAVGHRRRFGGGRGQPIAKAAGLKGSRVPDVVDATAGLGRDAFVLAGFGCRVRLVERHPVVAALLADGLRRASADPDTAPVAERMELIQADAVTWMAALPASEHPDVVYLDPMYPPREGSARVKKEMALFHHLVGADPAVDCLLPAALAIARERVVVKRPDYAGPLAGRLPTLEFKTKRHRFDVYVIKALQVTASLFPSPRPSP